MNKITHYKHVLEFDVWEPTGKEAQAEFDRISEFITKNSSHLGHRVFRLESEERISG